jgi:hypothetical protein
MAKPRYCGHCLRVIQDADPYIYEDSEDGELCVECYEALKGFSSCNPTKTKKPIELLEE